MTLLNFVGKHLFGGVAFVVGVILLIVGLFKGGSLIAIGAALAIGGIAFMAFNMFRGAKSFLGASDQLSFSSKQHQSMERKVKKMLDDMDGPDFDD